MRFFVIFLMIKLDFMGLRREIPFSSHHEPYHCDIKLHHLAEVVAVNLLHC